MRIVPRLRLLLLAALLTGGSARASWNLPPLDGELAGDITPTFLDGAPPMHWRVTAQPGRGGLRHVVFTAEGKGTRFRIDANVNVRTGEGTWKIADCVLDAATWVPVLASESSGLLVTATGQVSCVGQGDLRAGALSGAVEISWDNGSLHDGGGTWKLDGLTVAGGFEFNTADGTLRNSRPATVEVRTITTNRFGARNLALQVELASLKRLQLKSGSVEIAGGEITAAPCSVALQPFDAMFDLKLQRIGLQDVAALVPGTVSDARGRVNGEVNLGWSSEGGFKLGAGSLTMSKEEPAEVRLAPSPGLITNSLPPATRVKVLKYYPGLEKLEKGEVPIRADNLTVTFDPNGDAEGRTATIHLAGGPVDPGMRAPVDLVINVRGPLEWLIKMGTSPRLHFGD